MQKVLPSILWDKVYSDLTSVVIATNFLNLLCHGTLHDWISWEPNAFKDYVFLLLLQTAHHFSNTQIRVFRNSHGVKIKFFSYSTISGYISKYGWGEKTLQFAVTAQCFLLRRYMQEWHWRIILVNRWPANSHGHHKRVDIVRCRASYRWLKTLSSPLTWHEADDK